MQGVDFPKPAKIIATIAAGTNIAGPKLIRNGPCRPGFNQVLSHHTRFGQIRTTAAWGTFRQERGADAPPPHRKGRECDENDLAISLPLAILAACAGRSPQRVAVVQPQDRYADCAAIIAEAQADNAKIRDLPAMRVRKVAQNVAAGLVGLVIWPVWFGMDFQGAAGKEIAALQSREQYLAVLAEQRNCGVPMAANSISTAIPALAPASLSSPVGMPSLNSAPPALPRRSVQHPKQTHTSKPSSSSDVLNRSTSAS